MTAIARDWSAPALRAHHLYRFFRTGDDETLALRGVSLTIARGETGAVVVPSGSGKSTVLVCLACLDEPAGGSVEVSGEQISHRPEAARESRAHRIGVLLQSRNLLPRLDVRANIELVCRAWRSSVFRPSPSELLEEVGLGRRGLATSAQSSGGELARAGLAVALANNPDVLLTNEPTGELDGNTEQEVLDLLRDHAQQGTGPLIVTHSAEVVAIADLVLTIQDGVVAA
ncbi:ABC transporter ATP-binding protein [Amycolatopsis sp. NPDC004378]